MRSSFRPSLPWWLWSYLVFTLAWSAGLAVWLVGAGARWHTSIRWYGAAMFAGLAALTLFTIWGRVVRTFLTQVTLDDEGISVNRRGRERAIGWSSVEGLRFGAAHSGGWQRIDVLGSVSNVPLGTYDSQAAEQLVADIAARAELVDRQSKGRMVHLARRKS